ncbi:MAG: AsmA family protein [Deltaproteobacteria bacterium]|nr:AsmA family protein [Deltaproteobacteria bacterium]
MYTNVLKSILFAIGGLIGLLILISVALIIFVDTSVCKPWVERAAADALGMEVRVGGRMGFSFFPDLHVRLDDIRIQNRRMDIASAKEANLEIALLPLLYREVRIRKIGRAAVPGKMGFVAMTMSYLVSNAVWMKPVFMGCLLLRAGRRQRRQHPLRRPRAPSPRSSWP